MKISTLYPAQCTLGEGSMWHQRRGSYFWVDIEEGIVHELNRATNNVKVWNLNKRVSVILEQEDNTLILGVQGGLVRFDPEDGSITPLVSIDGEYPEHRCNDGAVDSEGRIWIGSMEVHCKENAGSFYRVDNGTSVQMMIDNLTIPNGIVWSHDHARMYFIETMSSMVRSYIFNKLSGNIYYEKVAVAVPESLGYPDGMAIDADGMLWIALYGGYGVGRWNPDTGQLLGKIELPAPHVTNCCFGGENLDELVITTARENLDKDQLAKYPESGDVLIVTGLGVKGVLNNRSNYTK
ncbi:MAG: SMP-30/gluconolactonase/LRE family protein [Sphingobacteriales bacterium]|nr:MAG: SMP-30/gluconolactonase/LRE family protein [Sphingobacteriales bacterium]